MTKMYDILVDPKMHLPPEKRAEADYLKASFDYGQWNPTGAESAGNSGARTPGDRDAHAVSHASTRASRESARYVLESAYRIAKMMQSANDPGTGTGSRR